VEELLTLVKFILFAALFIVVNELIQWLLRRLLKVKKKKSFSYNHVNGLHKKIDWMIRIILIIASVIAIYFTFYRDYSMYLYLVVILCINVISAGVSAFFEWKYSDTPEHSILTISEIVYIAIVIVAIIQFDVLALLT